MYPKQLYAEFLREHGITPLVARVMFIIELKKLAPNIGDDFLAARWQQKTDEEKIEWLRTINGW